MVDPNFDSGETFKVNVKYLDVIDDRIFKDLVPGGGWFARDARWQLHYHTRESDLKAEQDKKTSLGKSRSMYVFWLACDPRYCC